MYTWRGDMDKTEIPPTNIILCFQYKTVWYHDVQTDGQAYSLSARDSERVGQFIVQYTL
jgi:hypothetical protein